MQLQHLNVKFFVTQPEAVRLQDYTVVFNSWIQRKVTEELLIDVADYAHVVDGPGLILIGHEANYSLDQTGGRLGLLYNRKANVEGNNRDRLAQAFRSALKAAQLLEKEQGLKFDAQAVQVIVNDRLLAPNTETTRTKLQPDLDAFFNGLYGGANYTIDSYKPSDPRERFTVTVHANQPAKLEALLRNLS
jgi:hypothetical protein